MKIEIGKKYVTRDGGTATVVGPSAVPHYPFKAITQHGEHFICRAQGCVWDPTAPSDLDLVAEWEPYPHERIKELEEKLACSERAVPKWEETAAHVANVRDYYARIIKEVADVIGPAAYTSDDGTVQSEPLRARLACRVQDLQATILEQERQLERYKALVPAAPPALEMQVGGAYLTRRGEYAIVVSSDEDEDYPFDVQKENGSAWSITRTGTEFLFGDGVDDLVSRIRFPESSVGTPTVPEGFVYAGSEAPEGYCDTGDLRICYSADGGEHFGVRIGSPVHFAFAVKFCNEA